MIHKPLKLFLLPVLLLFISSVSQAKAPQQKQVKELQISQLGSSISQSSATCKAFIATQFVKLKRIGIREVHRFKSIWKKRKRVMRSSVRIFRRSFRNKNQFRSNQLQLKKS